MELTQVLLNAQAVDRTIRERAEESLKQFLEQNVSSFLVTLSRELLNVEKPSKSRFLAGLVLKNVLNYKEPCRDGELALRWLSLESAVRMQIKTNLLHALFSPGAHAQSAASQAITKIAVIELPEKLWPELIGLLLANIHLPKVHVKQATLRTLGYLLEEIPTNLVDKDELNTTFKSLVQAISASEGSNCVRLSAIKAACSALHWAGEKLTAILDCSYILRAILDATLSPDLQIRLSSFECLDTISSVYYQNLTPYIQDIFTATAKAIRADDEIVALQAIEFWISLCDMEIHWTEDSKIPCLCLIKQVLPVLVPLLSELLLKQDHINHDGEAWSLVLAGEKCLSLVSQTVGDDIIPLVMQFFEDNITKQDWKPRVAAICAFISILLGPNRNSLIPVIDIALTFLLSALTDDPDDRVVDSAACALGQIFEFVPPSTIENPVVLYSNYENIIETLLFCVEKGENIATKAYHALTYLARGYLYVDLPSPLNSSFGEVIGSLEPLLKVGHIVDVGKSGIKLAAFETVDKMMRSPTLKMDPLWFLLIYYVRELEQTLEAEKLFYDEVMVLNGLQGALCRSLQVIIQKLGGACDPTSSVTEYVDKIMSVFLKVFACANAAVRKEVMLAIRNLAYVTGPDFERYMGEFYKCLEMGLQNFENDEMYLVTVNVIIDVSSTLGDRILPYCDRIMAKLLENLSCKNLLHSMKRPILSCFGAIATAIGDNFGLFLEDVMHLLQTEAEFYFGTSFVDDKVRYEATSLRLGVLEAYSGIFKGFKNSPKSALLASFVPNLLQVLNLIYQKNNMDDGVTRAAIQLLGDVADALKSEVGSLILQYLRGQELLSDYLDLVDPLVEQFAEWAERATNQATNILKRRRLEKEFAQLLVNAQSVDRAVQKHAEDCLKEFQEQNSSSYLLILSMVLCNEKQPVPSRLLAGLTLKNALQIKNTCGSFRLVHIWNLLDKTVKTQIKKCLLQTLASPLPDAQDTASQVIAKIACIQEPQEHWPKLERSSFTVNHKIHIKQTAFKIISYMCKDSPQYVVNLDQATEIIRAIVQGENASEGNNDLAMTLDSNYIITAVVDAFFSPEMKTRLASCLCLIAMSSIYYQKLAPYIEDILNMTEKAIKGDEEPIAVKAVEFWISTCDVEIHWDADSNAPSLCFIRKVMPVLVPLLLQMLLKQDYLDEGKETRSCAVAGSECLGLIAQTVGDDLAPLVMQFFEENIVNLDWRQREAAAHAFGSIVLGPPHQKLAPIITVALTFILNTLLKDPSDHVKATAAWSLRQIFEFCHGSAWKFTDSNCREIMTVLLHGMKDVPFVAEKACDALRFLAQGCDTLGCSSTLNAFFKEVVQSLLMVSDTEVRGAQLKIVAYEALNKVVRCATDETAPTVLELVNVFVKELEHTLDARRLLYGEREEQSELRCIYCRSLQEIIKKVGTSKRNKSGLMHLVNKIMGCLLRVLACGSATVRQEAMLAVGAIANLIGSDFAQYMPEFYNCWEIGLQALEGWHQLYIVALGVMVDVCWALKVEILPYCGGIITQFRKGLSSNDLHNIFFNADEESHVCCLNVRLSTFTCATELAMAIGEKFDEHLKDAMEMLRIEAEFFFGESFPVGPLRDKSNILRHAILEAHLFIFQGFKNSPKYKLLAPYAANILKFLCLLDNMNDEIIDTAIQVLKVLADTLRSDVSTLILFYITSDTLKDYFIYNDQLVKILARSQGGPFFR